MANQVEIGWQTQISTEVRPWAIELAAELDVGDVPSAPASTLTDLLTGLAFPAGLPTAAEVVGTMVTQTVSGLVGGHSYRLVITTNMGGTKETATVLLLRCPY